MSLPVPGWYDDAPGTFLLRWWDGRGWTDYVTPRPDTAPDGWYPADGRQRYWHRGRWTDQWRDTETAEAPANLSLSALNPMAATTVSTDMAEVARTAKQAEDAAAKARAKAEADQRQAQALAEREARRDQARSERTARREQHDASVMARHAERAAEHAAKELAKRHDEWKGELAVAQDQLSIVEHPATDTEGALVLRRDEVAYMILQGAALVGYVPGDRQWVGASSGFSIPLGHTGIRYRTGSSRGHVVQAPPHLAALDSGTFVLTNQRAVFAGAKQTREWPFAKLIRHQIDAKGFLVLSSSNRKQPDEIAVGSAAVDIVSFRIGVALAAFNGTRDALLEQLRSRVTSIQATEPR